MRQGQGMRKMDQRTGERGCLRGPQSWRRGGCTGGWSSVFWGKQAGGRSRRKLSTRQGSPWAPDSGDRWEPNDDGRRRESASEHLGEVRSQVIWDAGLGWVGR